MDISPRPRRPKPSLQPLPLTSSPNKLRPKQLTPHWFTDKRQVVAPPPPSSSAAPSTKGPTDLIDNLQLFSSLAYRTDQLLQIRNQNMVITSLFEAKAEDLSLDMYKEFDWTLSEGGGQHQLSASVVSAMSYSSIGSSKKSKKKKKTPPPLGSGGRKGGASRGFGLPRLVLARIRKFFPFMWCC